MTSALTTNGSTRAWRHHVTTWQQRLNDNGGWPCWRCGQPIPADAPFHLGHLHDRALGGNDDQLAPEHPTCSSAAGGRLGAQLRARRRQETKAFAQFFHDQHQRDTRETVSLFPPDGPGRPW